MALNIITRTLIHDSLEENLKTITQSEITTFEEPVVVLGDPGLGKTVLTKMLGEQPGVRYYTAGHFIRADPKYLMATGGRIVIDGLDEIASAALGGGVEAVLKQLLAIGKPLFVLSCREADWRGAADRIKIEDDYAAAPVLLHLLPFDHNDAHTFLSNEFPTVDAAGVLDHFAGRGLADIYKNPLTLRLLGEVVKELGTLPNSRAELLDRACRTMLKEENPRHFAAAHAQRRDEEVLLAAGAMCATQLLCDRLGVFTGAYAKTRTGFVHVADIAKLPFGEAASEALKTRLFQAEGEECFTHVHRVIAEYLGAKWLTHCFEAGLSERRIFGLFRHGEGIPTSLRGLHAWTGHFSDALADRCIAADPFAVLRYGDAETLSLKQARTLLTALAKLSDEDPYFRSEDWGQHPASGLMREELKDEILAIISTPRRHTQLTMLLITAMVGTSLGQKLAPALDAILFNQARDFGERSDAADALRAARTVADWESVISRLLAMGDADSARLAVEILDEIGVHTVSIQTAVETVLAHLGLTVSQIHKSRESHFSRGYLRESLFAELDATQLGRVLDTIATYAQPLMREAEYWTKVQVDDLVQHLTVQILETDSGIAPERVWAWIGWLHGSEGYSRPTTKRLTEVLREQYSLRLGIIEHVLLTPCGPNTWMAGHSLADAHLGLFPTSEDLVGMLEALHARAGGSTMNTDTWRDLVRLGRSREGIAPIVHNAAAVAANGDPGLLAELAEMAEVVVPQWEIDRSKQVAKAEAERRATYRSHRTAHTQRAHEITAGNFRALTVAANVYLGRYSGFDQSATPEARLREFLGDALAEQALLGFMATLNRSDLPSAAEVANIRCKKKTWTAEEPLICGIAEMLRRGDPIDMIDRATLASILIAWYRAPESNSESQINIGPALEDVLFRTEEDVEAHFRASLEPQFACQASHIYELYRLTHSARWTALAGRLSANWLRTYRGLPFHIQDELITCALESASHETLQTLVVDSRATANPNCESKLLWLSVVYVVDFDNSRALLEEAATAHPEFFWCIRNRIGVERRDLLSRFSVLQLAFVVEVFGSQWPKVDRPRGVTSGDTNPWDATEFIERAMYAIASCPSPEATEALQSLVNGHARSYEDVLRHALALQRKVRRDNEYVAPTVDQLLAVMADGLPETIDDMRAYFADRIEALQKRIHGSSTDMWEAYWAGDRPKSENYCRNRLIEHISGQLPSAIRFEPEKLMPAQKRADIALIQNSIGLPVEIKGQWHANIWDAPINQLDAQYTRDWSADGRGAYMVLWFGTVSGKQLPKHPDGLLRPTTPAGLRQMLIDRIPEARRSQIDVYVIDVSKPTKAT